MAIELKLIDEDFAEKERLFTIYEEAFPQQERIPTNKFLPVVRSYGCTPWALLTKNELVGFTCVMHCADYKIGYIWYFAIAADLRNHGYGSEALQSLQRQYSDCQLILDIEQLKSEANNYEQRISRMNFYERNGFARTFVGMNYLGMDFELMCNKAPLRLDDFKKALDLMTSSLFHPIFSRLS